MRNSQDARGIALKSLAEPARAELVGDGGVLIDRVATLEGATAGAIAFLANPRYRHQLQSTRASAVIIEPRFAADTALPKLVTSNPYAAYARRALFHPPHPVALAYTRLPVATSARIAASATIGPGCRLGGARASANGHGSMPVAPSARIVASGTTSCCTRESSYTRAPSSARAR
jgi:UDP-3-O-[3-hydroxymyristoyl] glucosamine N-acyltransferase